MALLGLINHLKTHFPSMYQLYLILKGREAPPTLDEIAIASGKKALDPKSEADYLRKLEDATENIQKAFAAQEAQAAVKILHRCCGIIDTTIRVHGIKTSLNTSSPNGLSHVISPSMRLKKKNLSSC
jgi:hypothetical protein